MTSSPPLIGVLVALLSKDKKGIPTRRICSDIRMLIKKRGTVVDFAIDHHPEVVFGVVL
jgi:hypothetical protein